MKRVCAWCQKDLDSYHIGKISETCAPITHGICGDCIRANLSFKAKPLYSFLEQFPKPVFLITEEVRIVAGNSAGLELLGKTHAEVKGILGGDAFDCKYAGQPGGCGNTLHCKSCTIRNAVTETMQSGKNYVSIPAYPDLHHMTGEKRLCFLITTEKINESVLLRIDSVTEEDIA